jgi:hypothetical protein
MALSGFGSASEFTAAHQLGFRKQIAATVGVGLGQVVISAVTDSARRLLGELELDLVHTTGGIGDAFVSNGNHVSQYNNHAGQRALSTGVSVAYELTGLTEGQSDAAISTITQIGADPSKSSDFSSSLTSAFSDEGVSAPASMGVTVVTAPAATVMVGTTLCPVGEYSSTGTNSPQACDSCEGPKITDTGAAPGGTVCTDTAVSSTKKDGGDSGGLGAGAMVGVIVGVLGVVAIAGLGLTKCPKPTHTVPPVKARAVETTLDAGDNFSKL